MMTTDDAMAVRFGLSLLDRLLDLTMLTITINMNYPGLETVVLLLVK